MEAVNETDHVVFRLNDEGMGWLERAGLAGLYLSLQGAETWAADGMDMATGLLENLSWKLGSRSVEIAWEAETEGAFTSIVEWAWQVRDAVYFLPAVHRTQDELEHAWMRLTEHNGLLHTFFQHSLVMRRAREDTVKSIELEEGQRMAFRYRPLQVTDSETGQAREVAPCQHAMADKLFGDGLKEDGQVKDMASWIYPGAAIRFGTRKEKGWTGSRRQAFLLLFAPLACYYFRLPNSTVRGSPRQNWSWLLAEITDLESFARRFLHMRGPVQQRFLRLRVGSLGDAALRFAHAYATRQHTGMHSVRVVAMGRTDVRHRQSVRKRTLDLMPGEVPLRRYSLVLQHLPNEMRVRQGEGQEADEAYVRLASPRGRIAENLVRKNPWYRDLADPIEFERPRLDRIRKSREKSISVERLWFDELTRYWRWQLMALAEQEEMWDDPAAETALGIFHRALRSLLDKEEDALSRGGERKLRERWEDKIADLRRAFTRAKTREQFRNTAVEMLADAGGSRTLTEKAPELWNMLNDPYDWQKARDVGLLALVTFTDGRLGRETESPTTEGAEDE